MASELGGVWRTIRGRRVFIKDGEDLESAMKRSGKFATKLSPEEKDKLKEAGREAKAREIDEINSNPRKEVDYYLKKGEFSKFDQAIKDYGLEDEKETFLEGTNSKTKTNYKEYQDAMQGNGKYAKDVKSMTMDEYIEKNNAKYEKEIKYQKLKKEGEQELRRLKKENNYKSDKQSVYPSNWNTDDTSPMSEDSESAINKYIERKTGKNPAIKETYTKTGNIRYSAFGIERTPEDDFSDDGTRFTAYRLPNGMEMTVAKDNDDIYLSLRHPYHKEVSYEEYSSLPHYKDLDQYNGVAKSSVDLNNVIKASNEYMNEYNELLKSKGIKPETRSNKELRIESIRNQIENNQSSINYYRNDTDYSRWRYNKQQENRLMKKNDRLRKELEKLL